MSSPSEYTSYLCNQIVLDDGIYDGAIVVKNGKIHQIIKEKSGCLNLNEWSDVHQITAGVLMAGIVDSHVHINSPGRSEWEDFPCATRAAAAGGVTTLADMPLNSLPPTTTLENLTVKKKVAEGTVYVDVAFWGGVIPGNYNHLNELINAGVVGFKCFLCPSGVDEFPCVTEDDLKKAAGVLSQTNSLLAFHAECEINSDSKQTDDPEQYSTYLKSRPAEMEDKALDLIAKIAALYKTRYHIVHVSAASAAEKIAKLKKEGVQITAETCPHYLTLFAEKIPASATQYKCAPPVRSEKNQTELWKHIDEGTIDMIVSDHSPCVPELKKGGFLAAWGGISSLQFGLSLIWTHGSKRGMSLNRISKLLSEAPAKLCKIDDKKGALRVGHDADFIVFDPDDTFTVTEDIIQHKNKLTPYLNTKLRGRVLRTYVRGKLVYGANGFSERPEGKLLLNI